MTMRNKMKSSRIDIVSPSEPDESAKNHSMRSPDSVLTEIPLPHHGQVCVHCESNNQVHRVKRVWIGELVLGCVSGVLLVGLLLFIGSALNSWTERAFDHFFDHWVWHEPLDNWNL